MPEVSVSERPREVDRVSAYACPGRAVKPGLFRIRPAESTACPPIESIQFRADVINERAP
jgi:hypothetical protein